MTHQKAEVSPDFTPWAILARQYGPNPSVSLTPPLPSSVLPVHFTGEMLLKHTYLSLLQLWTVLCNVLLLQFLIYRNNLYWVGKEKKRTNELKTEQRPKCHDMSSKVSKSLRSHPSFLFLKGDCCFKIGMERNVWTLYPMSAVQQLHTGRCQKAEAGDQTGAGQREELVSSFTDHICPSGKQPTAHPSFSNEVWNNCIQISVETDLSTSPKISDAWECEKHQSRTTEMRSFKR